MHPSLTVANQPVASHLRDILLLSYYTPKQFFYLQTSFGWSKEVFESIDWLQSSQDLKHLSYGNCLAMFKLIKGQWPTYKQLHWR